MGMTKKWKIQMCQLITPIEAAEAATDNPMEESLASTKDNEEEAIEEVTVESELEKVASKYGLKTTPEVSYAAEDEDDDSPSNSSNIADIRETEEDDEEPSTFTAIEDKKETDEDSHKESNFATLEQKK